MNWLLQLLLLFFTEKLFVPKCARAQPSKLPGRVGLSTLTELSKREHTLKRIFFFARKKSSNWMTRFILKPCHACTSFCQSYKKVWVFTVLMCACMFYGFKLTVLGSNPSGCFCLSQKKIFISKCAWAQPSKLPGLRSYGVKHCALQILTD